MTEDLAGHGGTTAADAAAGRPGDELQSDAVMQATRRILQSAATSGTNDLASHLASGGPRRSPDRHRASRSSKTRIHFRRLTYEASRTCFIRIPGTNETGKIVGLNIDWMNQLHTLKVTL